MAQPLPGRGEDAIALPWTLAALAAVVSLAAAWKGRAGDEPRRGELTPAVWAVVPERPPGSWLDDAASLQLVIGAGAGSCTVVTRAQLLARTLTRARSLWRIVVSCA